MQILWKKNNVHRLFSQKNTSYQLRRFLAIGAHIGFTYNNINKILKVCTLAQLFLLKKVSFCNA